MVGQTRSVANLKMIMKHPWIVHTTRGTIHGMNHSDTTRSEDGMDTQRENTPEKAPVHPSDALATHTRGGALEMAWEALTAARASLDATMPNGSDRTYALDQLAARWLELADRLGPQGAGNAPVRPVERPVDGSWNATPAEWLREAQTDAQRAMDAPTARTVHLADGRVAHLWNGVPYVVGEIYVTPAPGADDMGAWIVKADTRCDGQPLLANRHNVDHTVEEIERREGALVHHLGNPTYQGVDYPVGSQWRDGENDVWIVTGVTSNGMPLMTGPDGSSPLSLRRVLELYAPLVRA